MILTLWAKRAQRALNAFQKKSGMKCLPNSMEWVSGQKCIVCGDMNDGGRVVLDVFSNAWSASVTNVHTPYIDPKYFTGQFK